MLIYAALYIVIMVLSVWAYERRETAKYKRKQEQLNKDIYAN